MIEVLLNFGLVLLASSSRRNSQRQKALRKRLELELEEKNSQIADLNHRVEEVTSQLQMALREKEKEWTGKMSAWKEETLKIGHVLRGEVSKLEQELQNLTQLDLGSEIKHIQELDDLRFSIPQKVSVRQAQKLKLLQAGEDVHEV